MAAIPAVDLAGLDIAQDRGLFARQVATQAWARVHPATAAAFTLGTLVRSMISPG